MAWVDISAGESGGSARGKINVLGQEFADSNLANVVYVRDATDFPAAVGGVRELTNGDDITYILDANTIDMGTDVFTVTGGSCVIIGTSRYSSNLVTAGTGDFFTITNAFFSYEFAFISSPNSPYCFNFTSASDKTLVLNNAVIIICQSVARINSSVVTSIRTLTTLTTTVGGFDFIGSHTGLNITTMFATQDWTGSLINLGTATFNQIIISSDNRFISPAGTTILSGAANSANINAGGRALVSGSIFNGDGDALSGITTQDLQWSFDSNAFADGTTMNTQTSVNLFLNAQRVAPIASAGVYVAIGGSSWESNIENYFTTNAAGLSTYIGLNQVEVIVTAISTVSKSGGGSDAIATKIALNGSVPSGNETLATTTNSSPTGITSSGIFVLNTGDTIQSFTANLDGTSDVVVDASNMTIHKV